MKRILLNAAIFVSVLFFPWWITVLIGVASVLVQKNFYEIIAWGVFYDLLYGTASISILGFYFFFTVGALALLYSAEFLKSKTRFE